MTYRYYADCHLRGQQRTPRKLISSFLLPFFCLFIITVTSASERLCSDEDGFTEVIPPNNYDVSNFTYFQVNLNSPSPPFATVNYTTVSKAVFTFEPYDGSDVIILSNPPNLYSPRFSTSEDNHTSFLSFEEVDVNTENLLAVGVAVRIPRNIIFDLRVLDRYAGVNVLPGFDHLRSILVVGGWLSPDNFFARLGGGTSDTLVHIGHLSFLMQKSTIAEDNFVAMNLNNMSVSYTIRGTIIEGKSSPDVVEGKEDLYDYESPFYTEDGSMFEADIVVEGSVSNFNHSFGHLKINNGDSSLVNGCKDVYIAIQNSPFGTPSCSGATTSDKVIPVPELKCTSDNICTITVSCESDESSTTCYYSDPTTDCIINTELESKPVPRGKTKGKDKGKDKGKENKRKKGSKGTTTKKR